MKFNINRVVLPTADALGYISPAYLIQKSSL